MKAANGLFLSHSGLSGHGLVLSYSLEEPLYSVPLPSFPSTQIQVVSAAHQPLARASCGTEGFQNAKKGTGIAAQTAGIAAAAVSVCSFRLPLCWAPLFAWLITGRKIVLEAALQKQEYWPTPVGYPNMGGGLKRCVNTLLFSLSLSFSGSEILGSF